MAQLKRQEDKVNKILRKMKIVAVAMKDRRLKNRAMATVSNQK
jgi:hypothetical protein